MRRVRIVAAALVWVMAGGCVIRDVDFADKRCPCDEGFRCQDDRCVPDATRPGVFGVTNLRAQWTTPSSIRWAWDPQGMELDLAYYELLVSTREDLAGATVWTVDDNPELGRYRLPRTGLGDVVTATITDGHAEDTFYYAQLVAVDTGSGRVRSNVAVGHTRVAPTAEIVLFDDTVRGGGYPLPECWQPTSAGEHAAGTAHLEWSVQCDGDATAGCATGTGGECWENLRRQGLTIDLSGLSEGQFQSAFLEYEIAYAGEHPAWYGETHLVIDGVFWSLAPLTYRSDGAYRRIQIPLSILEDDSRALTRADLGNLDAWRFGSQWTHGGTVRLDEARIRY